MATSSLSISISEPGITLLVLNCHVRVLDYDKHYVLEKAHRYKYEAVYVKLSQDKSEGSGTLEQVRNTITVHHTV